MLAKAVRPLMRLAVLLLVFLVLPLAGAAPPLDDDAGSGTDAPNTPSPGVAIVPGPVYMGAFSVPSDTADFYTFSAVSGDALRVMVWPLEACISFYAPSGALRQSLCTVGGSNLVLSGTANETGTWYLGISQIEHALTPYRFSLGVNGSPSDPSPGVSLNPPRFIQPGELVTTPVGSCTMNFVYNGTGAKAGHVYIGTAAHCWTALGQSASAAGITNFGTVVYLGDYAGINVGTFDNGIPGTQVDFSLIEINSAYLPFIKGEVKGHPGMPTALKAHSTVKLGDRFLFSGYGVGFDSSQPTREDRQGIYTLNEGTTWQAAAPITPGDSGGPVLHSDGTAVGEVTDISALGAGGPWLDQAISEASAHGFPIALRPAY